MAQLCQTLCNTMDCSLPGSSVHEILQARILEWIAMSSSWGSSWPRDQTCGFLMSPELTGRFFITSATWEAWWLNKCWMNEWMNTMYPSNLLNQNSGSHLPFFLLHSQMPTGHQVLLICPLNISQIHPLPPYPNATVLVQLYLPPSKPFSTLPLELFFFYFYYKNNMFL